MGWRHPQGNDDALRAPGASFAPMGLSLCYSLRLAGEIPEQGVLDVLRRLREHATTLGVAYVSPLFRMAPGEGIILGRPEVRNGENWFRSLASFQPMIVGTIIEESRPIEIAGVRGEDLIVRRDEPSDVATSVALGFTVDPGEGCELAAFGFHAPDAHTPPGADRGRHLPNDWFWDGWCKTQYASNISVDHFVRCHTSLVALLDAAPRLGVRLSVQDEGGFWEHRDVPRLVAEVQRYNFIMATFTRQLRDSLPAGTPLEAPIMEHPGFEQLETWTAEQDEIERAVEHDLELLHFDDDDEEEDGFD